MRIKTRSRRPRRGSALVEAALVLPVFLMFLLGILDYSRYVMQLQVVTNAAREGARYAVTHTLPVTIGGSTAGNATSDVLAVINKSLAGQQLVGQSIQIYSSDSAGNNVGVWTDTAAGGWICVKITGSVTFVSPKILMITSSAPVQTQAVARCESN